ncbi:unnamed protein product [Cylicocyclus nassatus]|uniref:Uncharacterized protein n=1 Tax=Cylicocyclus nassatus TaxID=53992 RepID=A0AA36GLD2_CYLNA|nr:unnamed protein product [Cylicocyclus nassatus]
MKRIRIPPVSAAVSDYIVKAVMGNRSIILENSSIRMMQSNRVRREAWANISDEIFRKFKVHLSPLQIRNHFNNRRKKVLGADNLEKRYRLKTGGGISPLKEHEINKTQLNDEDLKMYNYYTSKTAHKGLKSADSLQLAKQEQPILDQDEFHDEDLRSIQSEENDTEAFEDEIDATTFDEDDEPDPHNVSLAQLRKLEAKRIKF